jgi:hypothetical protein
MGERGVAFVQGGWGERKRGGRIESEVFRGLTIATNIETVTSGLFFMDG